MDIATNTLIATATAVASSSVNVPEVSPWVNYIVDIILIIAFLFIFFFVKPDENPKKEVPEEEAPNPLEQVLKTDSSNEAQSDEEIKEE